MQKNYSFCVAAKGINRKDKREKVNDKKME